VETVCRNPLLIGHQADGFGGDFEVQAFVNSCLKSI